MTVHKFLSNFLKNNMSNVLDRKRPREEASAESGSFTVGRDDAWYNMDDNPEGTAIDHDDSELTTRRHPASTDRSSSSTKSGSLRRTMHSRADEQWRRTQMMSALGASGGYYATLLDENEQRTSDTTQRKLIDLVVNRDLIPPFLLLDTNGEQPSFSKKSFLVLPVKDEKSDFAQAAKAGSVALREHKERKQKRKEIVAALETKGSQMDLVVTSGTATEAISDEEHERNRRRLQLERLRLDRSTNEKSIREVEAESKRVEVMHMKQEARLRPENLLAQGQTEFTNNFTIREQRKKLPIYLERDRLLTVIGENQVVILRGETGSGKTTQLVQYLYERGYTSNGAGIIGCTQPRRMAAVSVAHRVAQEMSCELGTTVGYAIRLEDCSSRDTKIKFMTDGVLMREIINDRLLEKYSCVVLDEAHERSVSTDVLLGVLKEVVRKRTDFRLIVTSATMDTDKFVEFFDGAVLFCVPGRTFEVEVHWEPTPVQDYVQQAVFRACEIHLQRGPGDILIFMTGEDDVQCVCDLLMEKLAEHGSECADALLVLPCYSTLPGAEQKRIMQPAPAGKRKCIVATNVAETSLTIDGIMFVIDSGLMKCKVFQPKLGVNTLQPYPVSMAQANQRKGRAGRTAPGECFRLFTQLQFQEELLPTPVPEIQRSSIDSVVLTLKTIGVDNLEKFEFIDPPPSENIRVSLLHLWFLGALDDAGRITADGRKFSDFPAEPPLAKTLLVADELGCSDECLTIAAVLAVDAKSIFTLPRGQEETALTQREKFFCPESDHVTLWHVLHQYKTVGGSDRAWADAHFLNVSALRRASDLRIQFEERYRRDMKLRVRSCNCESQLIREAFCAGYFTQAARRSSMVEFSALLSGVCGELHPTSAVHAAGVIPEYIIYNDFIRTSKQFLSVVTEVDPEWLIKHGRGLFHTKGDTLAVQRRLLDTQRQAALHASAPANSLVAITLRDQKEESQNQKATNACASLGVKLFVPRRKR